MFGVAVLGFGALPASARTSISALIATMLELEAFLAVGYLIVGRVHIVSATQRWGAALVLFIFGVICANAARFFGWK